MTAPTLPALIQGFFTDRLTRQRHVSPATITAYRDAFRLLLHYASQTVKKQPYRLTVDDLDAHMVTSFLDHLEDQRGNTTTTRNARLAAIRSFFRYAATRDPDHALIISQVLAIPQRRTNRAPVNYLTPPETEALIAAPDQSTWLGRRDHALLVTAIQTGLRLSELTGLTRNSLDPITPGGAARTIGKGRKDRATPLTPGTVTVLQGWLKQIATGPDAVVFPTARGTRLSPDAVQRLVAKHATTAGTTCSTITSKTVTPHTLRHTTAMNLLHAGVDTSVIALWLGHESVETTQIYLHADMTIKEEALAKVTPTTTSPGRFHPTDTLIAFLEAL
jgi:site-specific recombinase XerD